MCGVIQWASIFVGYHERGMESTGSGFDSMCSRFSFDYFLLPISLDLSTNSHRQPLIPLLIRRDLIERWSRAVERHDFVLIILMSSLRDNDSEGIHEHYDTRRPS